MRIKVNFPYERYVVEQLYYSLKQSPLKFISSSLKLEKLQEKKISVKNLNISLYELKLASLSLKDFFDGIVNKLNIVSEDFHTITGNVDFSTSSLSKFYSYSVEEITGNPSATEYTPINDVWGYLIIQGKKISVGMDREGNFQPFTLQQLKRKIMESVKDVEVKIENNRLYLFSNGKLNVADMTEGGKRGGLGIKILPQYKEEEVVKYLFTNSSKLKLEDFQKISSFSADQITGIPEADENTPLYGVYGEVIIQQEKFRINSYGTVDTLNTLKERINQNKFLKVVAEIDEEKRLILKPADINVSISIEDLTEGGAAGGLGLSRSAGVSLKEHSASGFYQEYRVNIISPSQKQLNISYSVKEITGNPYATSQTPLGLSGEIILEGKRIYLYENLDLKNISEMINSLVPQVKSYILDGRLVIEKNTSEKNYFSIVDMTTGGATEGLGINRAGYVWTSLPVENITGNPEADENTPLVGVSGLLEINGVRIEIGINYFDTLKQIAEKINSAEDIGVEAMIINNRLQLVSKNSSVVVVRDYTSGGFGGGEGALGITSEFSVVFPPKNSVYLMDDRVYSDTLNKVSDGVSGIEFFLKNPSDYSIKLQLTNQNNIYEIEESIKNFLEKWNRAIENLNQLLRIDGENKRGIFYKSKTLLEFYNKLLENFTTHLIEELKKIGIEMDKENILKLNEEILKRNIYYNLSGVLKIFGEIGKNINNFLQELIFSDGIPQVDLREETRFTIYKREKWLPVNIFKKGTILETTA